MYAHKLKRVLYVLTFFGNPIYGRTVVGETGEIHVTPSLEVKASPGLKPDRTALCERIRIQGLRRFKHIDKYAHSLKLIVNASTTGKTSNIDVCFHR